MTSRIFSVTLSSMASSFGVSDAFMDLELARFVAAGHTSEGSDVIVARLVTS